MVHETSEPLCDWGEVAGPHAETVNGVCDGRRRQPRSTSLPHRVIMKSDAARRMAAALCEEREARTCRPPKKTNKNSKRHAQIAIIKFIYTYAMHRRCHHTLYGRCRRLGALLSLSLHDIATAPLHRFTQCLMHMRAKNIHSVVGTVMAYGV